MNLRSTTLFFGLLLSMLWLFGLTLAWKKTAPSPNLIVPSLKDPDVKIHTVTVERPGSEKGKKVEDHFVKEGDHWYLVGDGQKARVEDFRIQGLINDVKNAKRNEDKRPSDDLAASGLTPPQRTITLKGTLDDREKVWTFNVGKETVEKTFQYVNSSDRPDMAYAVPRATVEGLLYKDPGALRSKRLFDFMADNVTHLRIAEGTNVVELTRGEDKLWRFVKPALGFAGFESAGAAAAGKEEGGVKGLLNAIAHLRADTDADFMPLGLPMGRYGLEEDKARLRIEITTPGAGKKGGASKEVLLVGKRDAETNKFYARTPPDQGVVEIDPKLFEPIEKALRQPGTIRSRDVAAFEPRDVDAITFQTAGNLVELYRPDGAKAWKIRAGAAEPRDASASAVQALLEALKGKGGILAFEDVPESEQKAFDTKRGLVPGSPVVTVYVGGISKDEAKGKEAKKTTGLALNKDKAALTLTFGTLEGDTVFVKRQLPGNIVSRFTMNNAILGKVKPETGLVLAFRDTSLSLPRLDEVDEFYLLRRGEKVGLKRAGAGKETRWSFKDPSEPTGLRPADTAHAQALLAQLTSLQALKWVESIGPKTDLEKLGLTRPAVAVTLVNKSRVPPAAVASAIGMVASAAAPLWSTAPAAAQAQQAVDKGQLTTIWFGKEIERGKEGPVVYARQSGVNEVFLVPPVVVKLVRDVDLRDRGLVLRAEALLAASEAAVVAGAPRTGLLFAAPLLTGAVHHLDPAQVSEVKITLRTPAELRQFTFKRQGKDWIDVTGLREFQLNSQRVNQLVETVARLRASQFVNLTGGPRSDQKLGPKDTVLQIELTTASGQSAALRVGAEFDRFGYFAASSTWPEAVFLMPAATVEQILREGVGYFARERAVAAE